MLHGESKATRSLAARALGTLLASNPVPNPQHSRGDDSIRCRQHLRPLEDQAAGEGFVPEDSDEFEACAEQLVKARGLVSEALSALEDAADEGSPVPGCEIPRYHRRWLQLPGQESDLAIFGSQNTTQTSRNTAGGSRSAPPSRGSASAHASLRSLSPRLAPRIARASVEDAFARRCVADRDVGARWTTREGVDMTSRR